MVEKFGADFYYSWDGKVWVLEEVAYKKDFIGQLSAALGDDERIYLLGHYAVFVKKFNGKEVRIELSSEGRVVCGRDGSCAETLVASLRDIAETVYNDIKNEEDKIEFYISDLFS